MSISKTPLAAVLVFGFVSCAVVNPRAGFEDVQELVHERSGQTIYWNQGTKEDVAASERIREMLSQELTVENAVQLALLNNRTLQATYEELGISQAAVVQAGLLSNPVFEGDVRFPEGGGALGIELSLVQSFLDVFYIPLRKRIAENAFEAAKLRVAGAVLDLAGEVSA